VDALSNNAAMPAKINDLISFMIPN